MLQTQASRKIFRWNRECHNHIAEDLNRLSQPWVWSKFIISACWSYQFFPCPWIPPSVGGAREHVPSTGPPDCCITLIKHKQQQRQKILEHICNYRHFEASRSTYEPYHATLHRQICQSDLLFEQWASPSVSIFTLGQIEISRTH